MDFKIGSRIISKNSEPFIIAEVGVNHNGELDKILEMIEVAKLSGADCVKFQTFKAEEFCGDKNQTYTYTSQGKTITEPMYDMFKRLEVKEEYWPIIKKKCDDIGIIFMSTPQNKTDLDILLKTGIEAIKVGSDDFITLPLLEKYKKTGLPMILSCGMASLDEIKVVLSHFENYPVALLLCTSQYPTPYEDVNLKRLNSLRNEFPNLILGFSDHTQGNLSASLAVAMGAVIFEKHFTLSHDLAGPDHWFSANPDELCEWSNAIKNSYKIMGTGLIEPSKEELGMQEIARRKLIAKCDIKAGETLSPDKIDYKRAKGGYNVLMYDNIVNKKVKCDIKIGEVITKELLEE